MSERKPERQFPEDIQFHTEALREFMISARLPIEPNTNESKWDKEKIMAQLADEQIVRVNINGIPARVVNFVEIEDKPFLIVNFYSEDVRKASTDFDNVSW